jgi:hypothetical protein
MLDRRESPECCWRLTIELKQANMEHIVQVSTRRQLESVGHVADLLYHLEWPEELGPEFAAPLHVE